MPQCHIITPVVPRIDFDCKSPRMCPYGYQGPVRDIFTHHPSYMTGKGKLSPTTEPGQDILKVRVSCICLPLTEQTATVSSLFVQTEDLRTHGHYVMTNHGTHGRYIMTNHMFGQVLHHIL